MTCLCNGTAPAICPRYLFVSRSCAFLSPGRNRREFSEHPAELGGRFAGQTETISDSYRNLCCRFYSQWIQSSHRLKSTGPHIPDTAGEKVRATFPPSLNPSRIICLSRFSSRNPFRSFANCSTVNGLVPLGDFHVLSYLLLLPGIS